MSRTDDPWKLLEIRRSFDCPLFTVRSDLVCHAGGAPRPYNSVRMKTDGVLILSIDSEGCTTLVGQHRYVLGRYSWELPGGGAPRGRAALDVARAELSEETGMTADHWLQLLELPVSPGTYDELTTAFVAWGLTVRESHPEAEEQLELRRVPFRDAVQMALRGEITHVCSVAAVLTFHARLVRGDLPADLAALVGDVAR